MVNGHMTVGIGAPKMIVRVGKDQYEAVLKMKYASEMDFTGRVMRGIDYVDETGYETDQDLGKWIDMALDFVHTLPPK